MITVNGRAEKKIMVWAHSYFMVFRIFENFVF